MRNIKTKISEFIIENKHYKETQWIKTICGKEEKITISDVQNYLKDKSVIEILVEDIKNMFIHLDKHDEQTKIRSQKANLSYPIIMTKKVNGEYGMILDGHHRLKKAIDNNIEKIKAKVVELDKAPKLYKQMFN